MNWMYYSAGISEQYDIVDCVGFQQPLVTMKSYVTRVDSMIWFGMSIFLFTQEILLGSVMSRMYKEPIQLFVEVNIKQFLRCKGFLLNERRNRTVEKSVSQTLYVWRLTRQYDPSTLRTSLHTPMYPRSKNKQILLLRSMSTPTACSFGESIYTSTWTRLEKTKLFVYWIRPSMMYMY